MIIAILAIVFFSLLSLITILVTSLRMLERLTECAGVLQEILCEKPRPAVGDPPDETMFVHRDRVSVFKDKLKRWNRGEA